MKFKSYIISALCVFGGLLTSCDNQADPTYVPAEAQASPEAYFSLNAENSVFAYGAEDDGVSVINIYRADAAEELTVPVTVSGDDLAPFTYPSSVTFLAEETEAPFAITMDKNTVEAGQPYQLTLTIGDGESTAYYTQVLNITIKYDPWVLVTGARGEKVGTYTDGLVMPLFGQDPITYSVAVEENAATPGLYRLVNPYGPETPFAELGGEFEDGNHYFYFNASDPNGVFVCNAQGQPLEEDGSMVMYNTGLSFGYGYMGVGGYYNFALAQGATLPAYLGTLSNGILTFPVKGLIISDDEDMYYGNTSGAFKFLFPGVKEGAVSEWTDCGTAEYTDGWYYPLFQVSDPQTWTVPVQKNADGTVYRLVNPFKAGTCPDGLDYDGDKYFEFDLTYPEAVLVLPQKEGVDDDAWGPVYFGNYSGILFDYNIEQGATAEQIYPWLVQNSFNDPYTEGSYEIVIAKSHVKVQFLEAGDDVYYNDTEKLVKDLIFSLNASPDAKVVLTGEAAAAAKANKTASVANYTGAMKQIFKFNGLNSSNFSTRLKNRSMVKPTRATSAVKL